MRIPVYVIHVDHPVMGWIPVGHSYRDKAVAKSWLSFVRKAWYCRAKVVHFATLIDVKPEGGVA